MKANYKTVVEMDALVGVSIALLTVWDMIKDKVYIDYATYARIRKKIKGV